MKPHLIDYLSSFSGVSAAALHAAARSAPDSYKRYTKRKKKGGVRVIFHPAKRTKTLQYILIRSALQYLPIHHAAAAYIKGVKSPLLKNALAHASHAFILKMDFKDFFPSIGPSDLLSVIRAARDTLPFRIEKEDEEFLSAVLFVRYPGRAVGLAVGAPSSPLVSNVIMREMDIVFARIANEHGASYTRYADDLVFSCDEGGVSKKIYEAVIAAVRGCRSPQLVLNESKTRFLSRRSRRPVTGLIIACDGSVSIGHKNKRKVRGILWRFTSGRADDREQKFLRGYLSFVKDVDPSFFRSLLVRYGAPTIRHFVPGRRSSGE